MMNLEEVEDKSILFQEFFEWLFDEKSIKDKNINLHSEVDPVLCPNYSDPNIYAPEQIYAFFNTKSMQRLNRVSQLGLAINVDSNLYHNRFDHSIGAYNKKVEELFYNYQDKDWKAFIEQNNMKLYLIAELIKMAGHDIGHLPLSHALEIQIFGKRGVHETIGRKIMLEDPEIHDVLENISPKLPDILKELYEKDILNFKQHDESNYDVDRLDYLGRDALYLGKIKHLPVEKYKSVNILTDENNQPKKREDNSIIESPDGQQTIDVYENESLDNIESALKLRAFQYKDVYFSAPTQIYETAISNFIKAFWSSDCRDNELYKFITDLSNSNMGENINIEEYKKWDEVKFYSELLHVVKTAKNEHLRDLAIMILPTMKSLLTLTYTFLNMNKKNHSYTDEEKRFLKDLKSLIKSDSDLARKLRDNKFFINNIILLNSNLSFLDTYEKGLINSFTSKIKPYKNSEPIYIKDKNNKIYEISEHPDSKYIKNSKAQEINIVFANIPYLRFMGVSKDLINKLNNFYPNKPDMSFESSANKEVNMSPIKVDSKIEDKFLEI